MTTQTPPRFYRACDAEPEALAGQRVAVLGYGNLGRPFALNFRDAGLDVVVGNRDDEYAARAREEGFVVRDPAEAVAGADVVGLLLPDEVLPELFAREVAPALKDGAALVLGSGYVLAFDLLTPPAAADVLLLAPRMLGEQVRQAVLSGEGFVSYLSVEQDATGTAQRRLLALAAAAGSLQRGALELTARQEALLDLFVEQGVGPYLGLAVQLAFEIGVESGLPAEAIVLELYKSGEMSRTFQSFADEGFFQSVTGHGLVATYGGFLGTVALDEDGQRAGMEQHFRRVLADLADGVFARKLQEEAAAGYPTAQAIRSITDTANPLSDAEGRVRQGLGEDEPRG